MQYAESIEEVTLAGWRDGKKQEEPGDEALNTFVPRPG